jgi:hypothetical protein
MKLQNRQVPALATTPKALTLDSSFGWIVANHADDLIDYQ